MLDSRRSWQIFPLITNSQGSKPGKLLSAERKKKAVQHVIKSFKTSLSRACRLVEIDRSTARYRSRLIDKDKEIRSKITELTSKYGRYGYKRITALLRRDNLIVNHKKVRRIWREEGLKVPRKQPKKGRLWLHDGSCIGHKPEYKNHVWSYDFVSDRTEDGKPIKMLNIMDEYSRECLCIDAQRKN